MSCYEWSHGEIVLPSREFPRVRKDVENAEYNRLHFIYSQAQAFWESLPARAKTDPERYQQAVQQYLARNYEANSDVAWLLSQYGKPKPRRILKRHMAWPTNRTMEFHDGDLSLTFDSTKRTVIYSVSENNHAREWADKTPIGMAFTKALQSVRWTAGSGGVILGNDEYNRESGYDREGGGGSYVVAAYGPIGVREAPMSVGTFLNSKGEQVGVRTTFTVSGKATHKVVPVSRWRL